MAFCQPTIATDHTDNSRRAVVSEAILTPSNVTDTRFGKIGKLPTDGRLYGQILYVPHVIVHGIRRNMIVAGDSANKMYAWDADTLASLWTTATKEPPCTSNCSGFPWGLNYDQPVGIFSTLGIDVARHWVFFVTLNNTPVYKLWKLNLLTGAIIGSPLTLTASVSPSNAADAIGGVLTFTPPRATQRSGITIANGNVYVAFSSVRDIKPWHGWIMARKEADLSTVGNFCTNWNQSGGGVWMSGSGPAVDSAGNLYVATGNGGTDRASWTSSYNGVTEFSMSILKLSSALRLLDWYTPENYAAQNQKDTDIGSGHLMLIPNPASAGNYLIVTGGKDYRVYSVHSECMGHLGGRAGGCPGAQVFQTGVDKGAHLGIYGDAHMNGVSYFANTFGLLYAFRLLRTGLYDATPVTGIATSFPGAMITGSTNGKSDAILWAILADSNVFTAPGTGKLAALNPTTLAPIWNSGTSPGNALGNIAKYLSPTVANGRVYVPTYDSAVVVYGLISAKRAAGRSNYSTRN